MKNPKFIDYRDLIFPSPSKEQQKQIERHVQELIDFCKKHPMEISLIKAPERNK